MEHNRQFNIPNKPPSPHARLKNYVHAHWLWVVHPWTMRAHNFQYIFLQDMAIFFYHAINRDTNVWERADEFIPERFDREKTTSDSPGRQFVSIPFGHGIRGCIGEWRTAVVGCELVRIGKSLQLHTVIVISQRVIGFKPDRVVWLSEVAIFNRYKYKI